MTLSQFRTKLKMHRTKKILIILDFNFPITEQTAAKILETYIDFGFPNLILVSQIEGKVKQQLLTSYSFKNQSIKYNKDVTSLDQLFYDKGMKQTSLSIGILSIGVILINCYFLVVKILFVFVWYTLCVCGEIAAASSPCVRRV